jgi:CrcB protein
MSDARQPERQRGPIDPDVDLSVPTQRAELHGHHPAVIGAIAAGGVIGSLARYQIGRWWPTPTNGFPSATLVINVAGCLLIGVLMALIAATLSPHPLIRPFFGTGILGGFTTFSTYAVDLQTLLAHGKVGTALAYLAATAIGAIAAAAAGLTVTRRLSRPGAMRSTI